MSRWRVVTPVFKRSWPQGIDDRQVVSRISDEPKWRCDEGPWPGKACPEPVEGRLYHRWKRWSDEGIFIGVIGGLATPGDPYPRRARGNETDIYDKSRYKPRNHIGLYRPPQGLAAGRDTLRSLTESLLLRRRPATLIFSFHSMSPAPGAPRKRLPLAFKARKAAHEKERA